MKRGLCLLVAAFALALAGCGDDNGDSGSDSGGTYTADPGPTPTETTAPAASDGIDRFLAEVGQTSQQGGFQAAIVAQSLRRSDTDLSDLTANDVLQVVSATCSEGTASPIDNFVDSNLEGAGILTVEPLGQLVGLAAERCNMTPEQAEAIRQEAQGRLIRNALTAAAANNPALATAKSEACTALEANADPIAKVTAKLTAIASRHRLDETAEGVLELALQAALENCQQLSGQAGAVAKYLGG